MDNKHICILGDLHFGIMKNSEIYFENQKNFLINQLIPYLNDNNISKIYFLGDMFDNRNSINTKIQNEVFNLFNENFIDFDITILVGNHDIYFNNTSTVNSIKFLQKFKNIKIIERPEIVKIKNLNVLLSPWITNNDDFIKYINDKNFDISLGHYDFNGFLFNKTKISNSGLNTSIISTKCKKIFSGHFHTRSKQIINDCEFVYIGSPYQLNRNDINEERGFVILNVDNLSYEFINNNLSAKFIKINYPQEYDKNLIKGNIVDIHLKYDKNYNENETEKYLNKINNMRPLVDPQIIIESNELIENIDVQNFIFNSIPDLMYEYINTIDIKNKEEIYKILIDLYNEVNK